MYKVTQEFMDELIKWKKDRYIGIALNVTSELLELPLIVHYWQRKPTNFLKCNNRLIAIIQWLNGEDVFEVEEPHKFVVRSDKSDRDDDYTYILVERDMTTTAYLLSYATKFNTREEAQEWANSHQVVVEVDAEGNEVE